MMGKYGSVLALVAGLGLAVAMRGTHSGEAPRARPSLPERARSTAAADISIGNDGPAATDLAGAQTGCRDACVQGDVRPLAPRDAQPPFPTHAARLRLTWLDGQEADTTPATALARLRAVPLRFAVEPLGKPASDAGLSDGPRLELAPTPEPHTWVMFITGMLMIGQRLRRRQSAYLATL
jgi:hypothetical protein